ncbi:MAG: hypothetical protein WAV51_00485 [Microgenomates group bacterium]
MKRFFCAVVVLVSLSAIPEHTVRAQTTTPIPTSPSVRQIDTGGALNVLLDNSVPFSIGGTEPSISITIKDVNLTTGTDFKVPKLETIANFFANGVHFLTPYIIKEKTIDQEKNLYISGRARYCKTNENNTIVEQESKQAYKTEIIPELSTLDQASRFAAAITSKYSISPVDGDYNYNTDREPLEIANAPLCDETDTGDTQETKTVKTTGGFFNTGGFLELLKSIFGTGGLIKATLASKQLTPYAESMDCLITGCAAGGDLSYLKSEEEQKRVQESGGVVETYAHVSHTITGNETSGEQDNAFSDNQNIKTHTLGTKAIEDATNYMKCAILPKALRNKYGLSDKCKQDVTTPSDCTTGALPTLTIKSECKLKNNSFGLSAKLIETIEAAASAYNVPASLMLGVMYGEGAFNPNKVFKTAGVDQYLDGCSTLPNCDVNASIINNIVPYFKSDWVDVADAVKIIDPNRTLNACNLTDGIFSLAKTVHRFQYAPAFAGKKCFGISLVSTLADTAQTCAAWKDENVESAIRFWEFGNGWDEKTKSCATKLNSCVTGGGLASQCPTGGDTCDTVQTPYSQPSHNACVWNVYKTN